MVTAMQEAMAKRGFSYRDLGFLTDLDAGHLCRVAHGKRRLSKPAALRVARALGISPRRLVVPPVQEGGQPDAERGPP